MRFPEICFAADPLCFIKSKAKIQNLENFACATGNKYNYSLMLEVFYYLQRLWYLFQELIKFAREFDAALVSRNKQAKQIYEIEHPSQFGWHCENMK